MRFTEEQVLAAARADTARQEYERGYYVVFASDLTATDDPAMQEPELATLRKGFALVLSADEIEARLAA